MAFLTKKRSKRKREKKSKRKRKPEKERRKKKGEKRRKRWNPHYFFLLCLKAYEVFLGNRGQKEEERNRKEKEK